MKWKYDGEKVHTEWILRQAIRLPYHLLNALLDQRACTTLLHLTFNERNIYFKLKELIPRGTYYVDRRQIKQLHEWTDAGVVWFKWASGLHVRFIFMRNSDVLLRFPVFCRVTNVLLLFFIVQFRLTFSLLATLKQRSLTDTFTLIQEEKG